MAGAGFRDNFFASQEPVERAGHLPVKTQFKPVNYYQINIGELVRKSKTRTAWHFDLDNVRYVFELEHSLVSGKKRLLRNNCLIYEEKSMRKNFVHELKIGPHQLIFA